MNFQRLLIAIGAVFFGLAMLLYVNHRIVMEKKDKDAQIKRADELERQITIDRCLTVAHENYTIDWNNACDLVDKEPNCSLLTTTADKLNKANEKRVDLCLERYK